MSYWASVGISSGHLCFVLCERLGGHLSVAIASASHKIEEPRNRRWANGVVRKWGRTDLTGFYPDSNRILPFRPRQGTACTLQNT